VRRETYCTAGFRSGNVADGSGSDIRWSQLHVRIAPASGLPRFASGGLRSANSRHGRNTQPYAPGVRKVIFRRIENGLPKTYSLVVPFDGVIRGNQPSAEECQRTGLSRHARQDCARDRRQQRDPVLLVRVHSRVKVPESSSQADEKRQLEQPSSSLC
jgi:hypothetical protein